MNRIIVVGRLGGDPELRYTQGNNTPVCTFSVATDRPKREGQQQPETDWHNVIVWGKQGEICSKFLTKGRQVAVEGTMQYRSWEDKQGVKHRASEINAMHVEFLGESNKGGGGGGRSQGGGNNDYDYGGHSGQGYGSGGGSNW